MSPFGDTQAAPGYLKRDHRSTQAVRRPRAQLAHRGLRMQQGVPAVPASRAPCLPPTAPSRQ